MKDNRVPFLIFLFVSIFFTFTFIKPSETHHIVKAEAEFSKRPYMIFPWTYYGCAGVVRAPTLSHNNEISEGWFRIRVYINGKGHNEGWDYRARGKRFEMGFATRKTVYNENGDDTITGYAESSITNQEDYAWDYDNVPEWQ